MSKKAEILALMATCLVAWFSLSGCNEQIDTELATRGAQVAQTLAAEGASAAQTAAAVGMDAIETQVADVVEDKTPAPLPHFTVDTDLNNIIQVSGFAIDEAIRAIRADSPLIGLGDDFVRIGNQKEINSLYIAAHAAWESTWGTSPLAQDKNNLFGYGAYNSCPYECAWDFETKVECIETVMTFVKDDYLTEGGQYYDAPTLRGMNIFYATDDNWMNGIASIMNSLAIQISHQ